MAITIVIHFRSSMQYRNNSNVRISFPNQKKLLLSATGLLSATRSQQQAGWRMALLRHIQLDGQLKNIMPLVANKMVV